METRLNNDTAITPSKFMFSSLSNCSVLLLEDNTRITCHLEQIN